MANDLDERLQTETFLEDLKRLAKYVESNGIPVQPFSEDQVNHMMDTIKGLAVICAGNLGRLYGGEQDGLSIEDFKPRVVMADATDKSKKICQILGVSETSGWVIFQDWFFMSVLSSMLKIQLKSEHWELIDYEEIKRWVCTEFRHFIDYDKADLKLSGGLVEEG